MGTFKSVIEIIKCCSNLEQLSLPSKGVNGNVMALVALPEELKHCHNMTKLRNFSI